jgi:hypothetical protein
MRVILVRGCVCGVVGFSRGGSDSLPQSDKAGVLVEWCGKANRSG